MIEDGNRLSISISKDGFSILSNLNGKAIINVHGNYTSFTLDKESVLLHIKNLQEALMTYKQKRFIIDTNDYLVNHSNMLIVRENAHYDWSLSLDGKGMNLKDDTCCCMKGFNKDRALRMLNKVYADILAKDTVLNPKRDIVRRVIDAGLLVWVHGGDSIVVYEKNVSGNYMINCMINGIFFPVVIVSTCKETSSTTLFNSKLEEIITFPLDESIKAFYPCDDEAF